MADVLAAAHDAIADIGATPREKLLARGVIAMMEDAEKLITLVAAERDELHEAARSVVVERREQIQHARETKAMCALDRLIARLDAQQKARR